MDNKKKKEHKQPCECLALFGHKICQERKEKTEETNKFYIWSEAFSPKIKLDKLPDCWIRLRWVTSLKMANCGLTGDLLWLPPNVTFVSLSHNKLRTVVLDKEDSPRKINFLDISDNEIDFIECEIEITSLNCSRNKLTYLFLKNKVKSVDISFNPNLEMIEIAGETTRSLNWLRVNGCKKLYDLSVINPDDTTKFGLDISHCADISTLFNVDKDEPNSFERNLNKICASQTPYPYLDGVQEMIDWSRFLFINDLDLHSCGIIHLTTLPPNLIKMNLCDNELESLPPLPQTLEELSISGNRFKKLPLLPKSLKSLYCSGNQLTQIDLRENENLNHFICYCNPIDTIILCKVISMQFNISDHLTILPRDIFLEYYEQRIAGTSFETPEWIKLRDRQQITVLI